MSTLRGNSDGIGETASYLGIEPAQVRAALAYYADFADDVDDDGASAREAEEHERRRWESERR